MSKQSKEFTHDDVFNEVYEQSAYAMRMLGASRQALLESHIGKEFGGKPPRAVMMHAMSRAMSECEMPGVDRKKLLRGLVSICVFLLEDEDVNLALRINEELRKTDKRQ